MPAFYRDCVTHARIFHEAIAERATVYGYDKNTVQVDFFTCIAPKPESVLIAITGLWPNCSKELTEETSHEGSRIRVYRTTL